MSQDEELQFDFIREDHPWLELPEDSLDEATRYSLDEIRIG